MAIVAAAIMLAATSVGSHAHTGTGSVESPAQTGSVHLHVVSAGFIVSTGPAENAIFSIAEVRIAWLSGRIEC
jgi:hypothetical protein